MTWIDLGREILEEFSECQGLHVLADSIKSRMGTNATNVGLYQDRKNANECVDCGGVPVAGHVRCKVCKIKNGRSDSNGTRKCSVVGTCRRCGCAIDESEKQCRGCLNKSLVQATSYYQKNKATVLAKRKEQRLLAKSR